MTLISVLVFTGQSHATREQIFLPALVILLATFTTKLCLRSLTLQLLLPLLECLAILLTGLFGCCGLPGCSVHLSLKRCTPFHGFLPLRLGGGQLAARRGCLLEVGLKAPLLVCSTLGRCGLRARLAEQRLAAALQGLELSVVRGGALLQALDPGMQAPAIGLLSGQLPLRTLSVRSRSRESLHPQSFVVQNPLAPPTLGLSGLLQCLCLLPCHLPLASGSAGCCSDGAIRGLRRFCAAGEPELLSSQASNIRLQQPQLFSGELALRHGSTS
mmetsp:Transcript_143963/g.358946  ORF Transcript_143963/g.358946 Transcript_143963/m.358946 type:complete len:272 (+) Transcript_143963:1003-1818(+)